MPAADIPILLPVYQGTFLLVWTTDATKGLNLECLYCCSKGTRGRKKLIFYLKLILGIVAAYSVYLSTFSSPFEALPECSSKAKSLFPTVLIWQRLLIST